MDIRTAFLTGASSGIGRALALRLAKDGIEIGLAARRVEELESVRSAIASAGGRARVYPLDVRNTARVNETIRRADDELGGLDLVIANAGLANNRRAPKFRWDECEAMLQVNVLGATATLTAVLDRMVQRKRGHVVGVSSLAGMRALPGMAAYGATKAYLSRFLEGLHVDLQGTGVIVTDVRPGFVETELTGGYQKKGQRMPFMISSEAAAEAIAHGIARSERVVAFPWQLNTIVRSATLLPEPVWVKGVRKMM